MARTFQLPELQMNQQQTRVIVFGCDGRIVEITTDQARAERIAAGINASNIVRRRRGREIVRIDLASVSDDSTLIKHRGNPRRYSHDHENEQNPPRCWTLRHISSEVQDIFRASVLDNLTSEPAVMPKRAKVIPFPAKLRKAA